MMKHVILIGLLLTIPLSTAGKVTYKYTLTGHSMEPLLSPGLIDIQILNSDKPEVGNIYCYFPDYREFHLPAGWTICHYLYRIEDGMALFYGLNNHCAGDDSGECFEVDPPVPLNRIWAEVII